MRTARGSGREVVDRFDLLGTRIPLVSLVYVLTAARHLNFRHAATALGVSQSSVSQRIKDLEGASTRCCSSGATAACG